MNTTSLSNASKEIALAARRATNRSPRPYVTIFGAGVSTPQIPLASQIENHCFEEAERVGRDISNISRSSLERYSYLFNLAYPHALDRQRYLHALISGKPLSKASLRLAHLLLDGAVTRIAVTPNFDDFVTRGLDLLGARNYRVCDHPATVDRVDPATDEIQIVHVHGTYWFYDLCNLSAEIDERAHLVLESSTNMLGLLDRLFANRSALVVGYSGWEGDVIMTALRRRLHQNRRLPYRLYWFVYAPSALDTLPQWLTSHPDVYIVLPDMGTVGLGDPVALAKRGNESADMQLRERAAAEPTLPAERVFDSVLREMDVQEPEITKAPLLFFASTLRNTLASEDLARENDLYQFGSVIARLEHAHEEAVAVDLELEPVRNAIRRSQYKDAILATLELDIGMLDYEQSLSVLRMLRDATGAGDVDPLLALNGVDKMIEIASTSALVSTREAQEIALEARVAKAVLHVNIGMWNEAIITCDELIDKVRAGAGNDEVMTDALFWKQVALADSGRTDESSEVLQEMVELFEESTSSKVRADRAHAMFMLAFQHDESRTIEERLALVDEILDTYSDDTHAETVYTLASCNSLKADLLHMLGRFDESLLAINEIFSRYSASSEPSVQGQVLDGFVRKAVVQLSMSDSESAHATLIEGIDFAHEKALDGTPALHRIISQEVRLLARERRFDEALQRLLSQRGRFKDAVAPEQLLSELKADAATPHPPYGMKSFIANVRRVLRDLPRSESRKN